MSFELNKISSKNFEVLQLEERLEMVQVPTVEGASPMDPHISTCA